MMDKNVTKERCFADTIKDGKEYCLCLTEHNCKNCSFYKPASKVNLEQTMAEIREYYSAYGG